MRVRVGVMVGRAQYIIVEVTLLGLGKATVRIVVVV